MDAPKKGKPGAILAIAFGKSKKAPGLDEGVEPDADDAGSSEDVGLAAASDAVFDAIKGGDRDGFAAALHSYVRQCSGSYGDDTDEG